MLQDLDARQTAANEAAHMYTKPVARFESAPSRSVLVAAAVGVVALAVAGALGWRYWQHVRELRNAPQPVKVVRMAPAPTPAKVPPAPAKPAEAPVAKAAAPVAAAPVVQQEAAPTARVDTGAETAKPVAKPRDDSKKKSAHKAEKARKHPKPELSAETKPHKKAERREKHAAESPARAVAAETGLAQAPVGGQGKQENAGQKAEAAYRRALASMQDGYPSEAIGLLEQALQANARHDAARQTLVSLLIENKRADDAMRQLQLGLTLDPRQPAMAMLLARLQIEHGGSGIETLTRTLPYVGANGEYHAFLAGALQRQQRHREAAEQYQSALGSAPQNGVWWMGLGISLQAEKRDAEALEAFRKAKGTGTLTQELLRFVDNKIQLLAR
jgi:MSHA biogenesis protein MshN